MSIRGTSEVAAEKRTNCPQRQVVLTELGTDGPFTVPVGPEDLATNLPTLANE